MMKKLKRIRSPRHRLLLSLYLSFLLWINRFMPRRARIHWVGRYGRPSRPERAVFAIVFLISLAWGARQYLFWSTLWGGTLAIFLNLLMVYWAFPRKRAHWIS